MTSQRDFTASSTEPLWWAPYEAVLGDGCIAWSGSVIDLSVIERIVLPGSSMPPGETLTYAEAATQVGRSGVAREVGAPMAKNRFAPMISCRRVVGNEGSLGGYAGGTAMKPHLLELEAAGE